MTGWRVLAITVAVCASIATRAEDRSDPVAPQHVEQGQGGEKRPVEDIPADEPVEAETPPAGAAAEAPKAKVADFPEVFRLIEQDAGVQRAYHACPADVFDTARPFWRRWSDATIGDTDLNDGDCDQDPLGCLSRCLRYRSGDACFQTARTLQDNLDRSDHARFQALFAEACALGHAGGCTNRAAGIENGDYEGDPMPEPEEVKTASCLFRSYKIACEREDAWGCTMHGLTFENGVGTGRDETRARAAYGKSCGLAPDFVACKMAESQIELLNATKEDPDPEHPDPKDADPKDPRPDGVDPDMPVPKTE